MFESGAALSFLPSLFAPLAARLGLRAPPVGKEGKASMVRKGLKTRLEPRFEPELPRPPSSGVTEPTPEPTPAGPDPTPKPPDRTPPVLARRPWEAPLTRDYIISLAEGCDVPLAKHAIEVHALQLLMFINDAKQGFQLDVPPICRGSTMRGIFAGEAEQAYYLMCGAHLWWHPHRWGGTNGLAQHFRRLLGHPEGRKPPYRWRIGEDGREHHQAFYPVKRGAVLGPRGYHRTPKPTPKRTPRPPRSAKRKRPRLRVVGGQERGKAA